MTDLIISLILFVLCFIFRLLFYMFSKKRSKKRKKGGIAVEMQYLINRFNLSEEKLNKMYIASIISFLDAFIISLTIFLVVTITENTILQMFLGLVIVIVLILGIYEILGRILKKRGFQK